MHILIFIIGILFGIFISALIFVRKLVGTLLVTKGDEDGPYLSLALNKNVADICNKKYVTLRIRQINTDYYE